jgi:hypothetical protein
MPMGHPPRFVFNGLEKSSACYLAPRQRSAAMTSVAPVMRDRIPYNTTILPPKKFPRWSAGVARLRDQPIVGHLLQQMVQPVVIDGVGAI